MIDLIESYMKTAFGCLNNSWFGIKIFQSKGNEGKPVYRGIATGFQIMIQSTVMVLKPIEFACFYNLTGVSGLTAKAIHILQVNKYKGTKVIF